jgi:uncharacterized protein with ATP-grasp and redox domains
VPKLPEFSSVLEFKYGQNPHLDAWLLHFMTENNLEHYSNPDVNASKEQMRFMVVKDEDQIFAPCSDEMFVCLFASHLPDELLESYKENWRRFIRLMRSHVLDLYLRRKIVALSRHKFRQVLNSPFMIPSRFMKRLLTIFLTQSAIDDPLREEKKRLNQRAHSFMQGPVLDKFLNVCDGVRTGCNRIQDLRWELDLLELKRLLGLATWKPIWEQEDFDSNSVLENESLQRSSADCEKVLTEVLGPDKGPMKILFLPDDSGGFLIDILVLRSLIRQGHKIIVALKEGFFFYAPTFWDHEQDSVLSSALEGAQFLTERQLSKNELLKAQRENDLLIISDGTREKLNLYRTNVTFARAWKEADLILAKGEANHKRLIRNSHQFTRDVLCFYREKDFKLLLSYKPKSESAYKFTEEQLLAKSEAIINQMRQAKRDGKNVMFYSAIIGSIPGQTKTAIKILNRFVEYLRERLEHTFIINPAEHFATGMDGDDLMYMWERVQRSGLIDVWRFQTVEDIETSFGLAGEKVPPIWIGKDATYSTGCTKEMHIALDMQKKYPELQIIGPTPNKFFRRREYGVGKFFDESIER